MVAVAPPVVIGPVLETSTSVRVDGVVANAEVTVIANDDGTVHAQGTAQVNGTVWLHITEPLRAGTFLFARQQLFGAEDSEPSNTRVPVVSPPHDLPRPVFRAVLNECSDSALLTGLVPGAEVTLTRGGVVLANEVVERTRQWVRFGGGLTEGEVLSASQTLPGSNPSGPGLSEPAALVDRMVALGAPTVGPIGECQAAVDFSNVVPTAVVSLTTDDGQLMVWYAPDPDFRGILDRSLPAGSVKAFRRCTQLTAGRGVGHHSRSRVASRNAEIS
jgi:hypothetical protein